MPATPAPHPAGSVALDTAPVTDLDGLTPEEFAGQLRVCARTVERRIAAQKFPYILIAGKRRIPGPWVRALFAAAIATGHVVAEEHGAKWIAAHAPSGGAS